MSNSTLVQNYTLNRNMLGGSASLSADRIATYIELVGEGLDASAYSKLPKNQTNDISAIATNTGLFRAGNSGGYFPTDLNRSYRKLQAQNKTDAWQWLLTRTLWHQEVPNSTLSRYNAVARDAGVSFNLFRTIVGLLQIVSSLPEDNRFLYFPELIKILSDDDNWGKSAVDLFQVLLLLRQHNETSRNRPLLGDLEDEVSAPRDNLNGVFVKAYRQTGLFSYKHAGPAIVGIALATDLSITHQRRLRHVLDNSPPGDPNADWPTFIGEHANDLPLEVEPEGNLGAGIAEDNDNLVERAELNELIPQLKGDLDAAGLRYEETLLTRFVAALLTKPFVILTGLSGSGKTKLAEAFAVWLEAGGSQVDPLTVGSEIRSTSAIYRVVEADRVAVVLATDQEGGSAKLTTVPRGLIQDWVQAIRDRGLTRETSAKDIREIVSADTNHDLHLNGFTSQLKAAAFAILESNPNAVGEPAHKIVPVGADWTSGEFVLGYADALSAGTYVRRPSLDIMLSAHERPHLPHFLVLDEMNLSHVERYFAEVLSALETGGRIDLYSAVAGARSSVPPYVEKLPPNLNVVGTVNVDETTYMFSPKVLDRANVIEFRVSSSEMASFLDNPQRPDLSKARGRGLAFSSYFDGTFKTPHLSPRHTQLLKGELALFFAVLAQHGAEFGYRVANEIAAFISSYMALTTDSDAKLFDAFDAQILQKLLPKIHGAEREARPVLWALAVLAGMPREWTEADQPSLQNEGDIRNLALSALRLEGADPLHQMGASPWYPLSHEKILRMLRRLSQIGYVAYAEG